MKTTIQIKLPRPIKCNYCGNGLRCVRRAQLRHPGHVGQYLVDVASIPVAKRESMRKMPDTTGRGSAVALCHIEAGEIEMDRDGRFEFVLGNAPQEKNRLPIAPDAIERGAEQSMRNA